MSAVRAARDADMAAVQAIYAGHVLHGTATFELDPPDLEEMARRRAGLLAQGLPWLVAEAEGEVLGFAYAGPYRPRPAYRNTLEDSIYLRGDATGRGLGRRLLAALIAETEAQGYRQMLAVIGDSANAASIGVHAALGFREVGVLRAAGFKFGRWIDVVLMQRALGPGATTLPDRP